MNDVVAAGHFRPLQSFDCASKTELGEAIEEPLSSWFRWSLVTMDATVYYYHAVVHGGVNFKLVLNELML